MAAKTLNYAVVQMEFFQNVSECGVGPGTELADFSRGCEERRHRPHLPQDAQPGEIEVQPRRDIAYSRGYLSFLAENVLVRRIMRTKRKSSTSAEVL